MSNDISVEFSIGKEKLFIFIDGVKHNISKSVPVNVWGYKTEKIRKMNNPTENWKTRVELSKIVRNYLIKLDNTIDVNKIVL